jgi:hypothetical protein
MASAVAPADQPDIELAEELRLGESSEGEGSEEEGNGTRRPWMQITDHPNFKHSLPTEQVMKSLFESRAKADGRLQRCAAMLKNRREASQFDLESQADGDDGNQICVGDNIACYVGLKKAGTRTFVMVVCEVVQAHGPSGRQARVPFESPNGDDAELYSLDVRTLSLGKGSRTRRGEVPGWNHGSYGPLVKGIAVEDVVVVCAHISTNGAGGGAAKPMYTFGLKALQEAADR